MHQPFATKREEHAKKKHDPKKGWAKQLGWTTAKEKNGKNTSICNANLAKRWQIANFKLRGRCAGERRFTANGPASCFGRGVPTPGVEPVRHLKGPRDHLLRLCFLIGLDKQA